MRVRVRVGVGVRVRVRVRGGQRTECTKMHGTDVSPTSVGASGC